MKQHSVDSLLNAIFADDHTCHRCDKPLPDREYDPFAGCLVLHAIGGYAMFHDRMDLDCDIESKLCHDCSVQLFKFLGFDPATQTDMRGLHPSMDENGNATDVPCCEFCWVPVYDGEGQWNGETYYGYEYEGMSG